MSARRRVAQISPYALGSGAQVDHQNDALMPVLAQFARWGRRHMPVTPECGAHAGSLEAGGSALLDDLRTKLRLEHLDPV